MEQQLEIALGLTRSDVLIRYVLELNQNRNMGENEIWIEKHKLETCPGQVLVLNGLQKRIGRSEILKSKKYTLCICVLLLLSTGYCVTSSVLENVEDSFIERCWECIHVVCQNVPIELSQWIQSAMGTRTPSGYAALFCTSRPLLSSVDTLKSSISGHGKFLDINASELEVPETLWHRTDVVRQTMLLHMRLQDRELS